MNPDKHEGRQPGVYAAHIALSVSYLLSDPDAPFQTGWKLAIAVLRFFST